MFDQFSTRLRSNPPAQVVHLAAAAQHPARFWPAADDAGGGGSGGGGSSSSSWAVALARARACAVALAPLLSAAEAARADAARVRAADDALWRAGPGWCGALAGRPCVPLAPIAAAAAATFCAGRAPLLTSFDQFDRF